MTPIYRGQGEGQGDDAKALDPAAARLDNNLPWCITAGSFHSPERPLTTLPGMRQRRVESAALERKEQYHGRAITTSERINELYDCRGCYLVGQVARLGPCGDSIGGQ